jgi:uncharacterized protein YodC (DUF2158 family)
MAKGNAASTYKPGDIVKLKSGGPNMTVTHIHADGDLVCQWFAGSKLSRGAFNPGSIEPVGGKE